MGKRAPFDRQGEVSWSALVDQFEKVVITAAGSPTSDSPYLPSQQVMRLQSRYTRIPKSLTVQSHYTSQWIILSVRRGEKRA